MLEETIFTCWAHVFASFNHSSLVSSYCENPNNVRISKLFVLKKKIYSQTRYTFSFCLKVRGRRCSFSCWNSKTLTCCFVGRLKRRIFLLQFVCSASLPYNVLVSIFEIRFQCFLIRFVLGDKLSLERESWEIHKWW